MINSPIKTLLTILPVLTAFLYMIGGTYHQSYLEAFGIEDSMFSLSIDRLLFLGFYVLIQFSLIPVMYSFLFVLVFILVIAILILLSSATKVQGWYGWIVSHLKKSNPEPPPTPVMKAFLQKLDVLSTWAIGIFLIFMLLLLVAFLSRNIGHKQALDEIQDFTDSKGYFVNLTSDQFATDIRAIQIICGTTYCAYWSGTKSAILKHEQIKKIVGHLPVSLQKKIPANSAP